MVRRAARILTQTSKALNNTYRKKGFTLIEILIVLIIVGLGFMTIAPRFAENTILSDKTEVLFQEIIENHLKEASELNVQVFITLSKGSSTVQMSNGDKASLPAGTLQDAFINDERTGGSLNIYFYPDGIFDQFVLKFSDGTELESYPALLKVVRR